MADDDIAALLEDAAQVMTSDDDDEDDGSFMSPGFVLREIDERKSPTELVNSHHSSSSAKLTPTTFLDRMLNHDGELKESIQAPDLDGPSAILEDDNEDDADEEDSEDQEIEDEDDMEDAKMEEDLADIEALMLNQSLTDKSHSSTASKDAFELLMSQSVSDILKEQTTPVVPKAPSPPSTPKHKPSAELEDQKSPVDRALSGLFKSLGGVFLQRINQAPIDEEAESDIEAEQDTPKVASQDEDLSKGDSKSGLDSAFSFSKQLSREGSDDAMSFVTATEQMAEPTPRSLYMPPLETVESMDQATPKRGNEKLKPPSLGTEIVVNEDTKEEEEQRISPMATLPETQVEQVFRTNEVLVHPQHDLVSLSSASSTISQVSRVEANSRWIKHSNSLSQTFNPSRSIFATKSTYDSNISPPGSPPEPVYSWADNEVVQSPVMTFPEAINWEILGYQADDVVTETSSVAASDHGSRFSGKHRINSPERVANTMSDMRRVKSPERKGSSVASPSKPRNSSLEEKLASVLALKPIGLPFRYSKPKYLDYVGSLLWQQLLAHWKHTEMALALTTQPPSRHFEKQDYRAPTGDDGENSSVSSRIPKPVIENLCLSGTQFSPRIRPETKNLDGFFPGDGISMTGYISSLPSRGRMIRHDVDDLLDHAEQTTTPFAELMEAVVTFARFDSVEVSYEVNVKDAEAITRKARQKYNGDVRQVKDVLRSKIIFPTESSLVCGLVKLFKMAGDDFKVVRVKNLFRKDDQDKLVESYLPTSYRHILLNIRWKSGFLSAEGYSLHRSLSDMQDTMGGFHALSERLVADVFRRSFVADERERLADVSLSPCTKSENTGSQKENTDSALEQFKVPNLDETSTNAEGEDVESDSNLEHRPHIYREELRKAELRYSDVFLAALERAALETTRRPRDLPTHCCCYFIMRSLLHNQTDEKNLEFLGFGVKNRKDLAKYTKLCLDRALKISNQATAVGMYGWIEYGTRSSLARLYLLPFDLMRLLSYDYARLEQWEDAEETLRSRFLRCEQRLPKYHPTTLICMIDLAVASKRIGEDKFASRLMLQAAVRLSDYLKEMEKDFLNCLAKSTKLGVKPGDTIVRIEHGRDALLLLQSFVSIMRREMEREMVEIVSHSEEAILTNRCFFAEALCILANCKSGSRALAGCQKHLRTKRDPSWKEAADYFSFSLSGLLKHQGVSSTSVARSAFGLARCLRELNESDKALELLSIVAATHFGSHKIAATEISNTMPEKRTKTFLTLQKHDATPPLKKILASICLWLMATLAIDRSPDEEGRGLAFRYLHAASVHLQTALKSAEEDDPMRSSYIQFLSLIEDEALQIAEPIYE